MEAATEAKVTRGMQQTPKARGEAAATASRDTRTNRWWRWGRQQQRGRAGDRRHATTNGGRGIPEQEKVMMY